MISIENETGEFVLSQYGSCQALGFRGNQEFIERCQNFAINFGLSGGKLYRESDTMAYVVTNNEKILNAFKLYFYCQTIRNKEIPVEINEENDFEPKFDEALAEQRALEKAQKFISEKIIQENFMSSIVRERLAQIIQEHQFN